MCLFDILQTKQPGQVSVWGPPFSQKVSKYVTCAILAPCLSNLPSLILSPAALILVPSAAIRPSHFLFRRIWTLLTAQASAASLSDSQQTRQDKQERTEHFIQITTQTLDGRDDNAVGRHFEKIVLVKHPHLDRSYLVFWDCLFYLKPLSAQRSGAGLLLTDASILGRCIYSAVRNLIWTLWGPFLLLATAFKTQTTRQSLNKNIFIVTCTCHGHWHTAVTIIDIGT